MCVLGLVAIATVYVRAPRAHLYDVIGLSLSILANIFSSNRSVSPEAGPRAEGLETVFLYIMPITSIYHFTFMYSNISLMQVSNETLLIGEIIYMSYFHF